MKKLLPILLALLIGITVIAQDKSKLLPIKKIYVDYLGTQEGSALVREKIKVRILKSERFTLVETPEAADAILTGVAGVDKKNVNTVHTNPNTGEVQGNSGTVSKGVGVLRLVDANTDETIWFYEYKRGLSFGGSAASLVANKSIDKLLKDAKEAEKKDK